MTVLTTTVLGNSISVTDDFPTVEKVSLELNSTNPVSVDVTAGTVNAPALQTYLNSPEAKTVLTKLFSLSGSGAGISQLVGTDVWELSQNAVLTWAFDSAVPYFDALLTDEALTLTYHLIAHDSFGREIPQDISVPIVGVTKIINVTKQDDVTSNLSATPPIEGINAALIVTTEKNSTLKIFDGTTDVTGSFLPTVFNEQSGISTVVFKPLFPDYFGKTLTVKSTSSDGTIIYDSLTGFVLNAGVDLTPPSAPTIIEAGANKYLNDGYFNLTESANNFSIKVNLPTTGSLAVSGDKVHLFLGGASFKNVTLTTTDMGVGYVEIPVTKADLGADGSKEFTTKIIDTAGNTSPTSTPIVFVLDSVAPVAPTLAEQSTPAKLADNKINAAENATSTVFRATLPAAVDKVEWQFNSEQPQIVTVGSANFVDFTVPSFTTQGENTLTAYAIDAAGNRSVASQSLTFAVNTAVPAAPTLAEIGSTDLADNTMNAEEAVSTNFRVSFQKTGNGAAAIGDTVTLQTGSTTKTVTLTSANTSDSYVDFTITKADLGTQDGTKEITAKIINAAGNESSNAVLSFNLLTTPPAAPKLGLSVDTGKPGDFITSVGRVSVSGLVAGAKWQYSIDNASHWAESVAKSDGTAEFTVIGDGNKTILARQIDASGNLSAQTSFSFTLDTSAPITLLEQGSVLNDTYLNAAETTVSFRVNLIGDVLQNDTVSLLLGNAPFNPIIGRAISNLDIFNGYMDFSVLQSQLGANGTKSISAQLVNAGTAITTKTKAIDFILDTVPPNAPSVVKPTVLNDDWMNNAESLNTFVRVNLPTDAVIGDSVELFLNGNPFSTAKIVKLYQPNIVNGFADFSVLKADFLGSEGTQSFTAKVTDIARNTSSSSSAITFKLDTIAPTATIATAAFDFWNSTTADESKTIQINVTGAVAGDKVDLLLNGALFKNVIFTSGDSVSIPVPRADLGNDGLKSFTTVITDAAGNKSIPNSALTFTLDKEATFAPILGEFGSTYMADGFVNNAEGATTIFRVTLPTQGSHAVAGDKVQLIGATPVVNNIVLTTDDILKNGYIDFTVLKAGLGTEGQKSLTAKIIDKAGNESLASLPIAFVLDTTAPATPTFASVAALSDNKLNNAEAVSTVFRVNLTTAVKGDKVELLLNAGSFGVPKIIPLTSDVTNGYVEFIVKQTDLGVDGTKSLTAKITDLAGNTSTSTPLVFDLKAALPTTPQLSFIDTGVATDGITNNPQVTISKLDSATTWEYKINDASWTKDAIIGNSFNVSGDGVKSVSVRQTDAAGNISSVANLTFTYDSTPPTLFSLVETTNRLSSQDRFINNVEAANVVFRANLNTNNLVGDKVELLLDNGSFTQPKFVTLTEANKTKGFIDFTLSKSDFGNEGSKSIKAKITDIAGNFSTSSAIDFTFDTVATNAPTVTGDTSKLGDNKLNALETATPTTFRVDLPTTGIAALADDKVELLLNGVSKIVTLSSANITDGYVDVPFSKADLGADGVKNLTAVIIDQAGNRSSASATLSFTLKATLPATPAVSEFGTSYLSDYVLNYDEAASTIFQVSFPKNTLTIGDKVELFGGVSTKTVTVNSTDISNGYVNFTVLKADLGADGSKALFAKITDTVFNNVSLASKAIEFVLNTSTTTTNFRVELPALLAVAGNTVEVLKDGVSFNPKKMVTLTNSSLNVDFSLLTADIPSNSKLTSVITQTGTANRYYLDSSFSESLGIKTTITTMTAKSSSEVLLGKTVTTIADDKGYLKTTIQDYNASNALSKTTITEGVKKTVIEGATTTISIDTIGLTSEIGTTQTAYKIIERDGSTTTYYLNNSDNALVNYNNAAALNSSTTSVKFYDSVGAFLSRTDTTTSSASTLISHYNSANVLTDSTLIEGIKTTTKDANGVVTNIKIDVAKLTAIPDLYDANLVNYVDGNTTYTIDLTGNLVRYSVLASQSSEGSGFTLVTTKINQIYNNVGVKIGDSELITSSAHSDYKEATTVQNNDGTKTVTNTVIHDGYKQVYIELRNAGDILLSSQKIDGIKTTSFNANGVVTGIVINTNGLTFSTIDSFKVYTLSNSLGDINTYYLKNDGTLEKYGVTQINDNTKTTDFFNNLGALTSKSISVTKIENGVTTISTKTYNVLGDLISSSQTEGIKTTNYYASGVVSSITIDTTNLIAEETTDGLAYIDETTHSTYYLNPVTNALIKYKTSNETTADSKTITNTFFYDNKGVLTESAFIEKTAQRLATTRYDSKGDFIDKIEVEGKRTTSYDAKDNVKKIIIDVTNLDGKPDALDSTKTHYVVDIDAENTIDYLLDANQELVSYEFSQKTTVNDTNAISHSLLKIAMFNEKGALVSNSSVDKYTVDGVQHLKTWSSTILETPDGRTITDVYNNDGVQISTTKNYALNGDLLNSSRTEGIRTIFYKANDSFDKVQINIAGLKELTTNSRYSQIDSSGIETIYNVTTGNTLLNYEVNRYDDSVVEGVLHHLTDTQNFNPKGELTGSKVTDAFTLNAHNFKSVKQYDATGLLISETKTEDRMTTVFNSSNQITNITFDATDLIPESAANGISVYVQQTDAGIYRYSLTATGLSTYSFSISDTKVEGNVTHQTTLTKVFNNLGVLTSTINDSVDSFTAEGILRTIRSESTKTTNLNGSISETVKYFNDGNPVSITVINYDAAGVVTDKTQTVGHKITAFDSTGKVTRVSLDVASTNGTLIVTSNDGITTTYFTESANDSGSYTLLKYSVNKTKDSITTTTTYEPTTNRAIERLTVDGTKTLKTTITYNADNSRVESNEFNIDGRITSSVFSYSANGALTTHTETNGRLTRVFDATDTLTKMTIDKTGLTSVDSVTFKETIGNVTTTYYLQNATSNELVKFTTEQEVTGTRTISDTNTFNNVGVLTAKTHTEKEGTTELSNSMTFNTNGTKTITDKTITDGNTFISTVIRKISDDSIESISQSDGIKTIYYKANGTFDHYSIEDLTNKSDGVYTVTDTSHVKTEYTVTNHALTKYVEIKTVDLYKDATKTQSMTTTRTFDPTKTELDGTHTQTASSIVNTVTLAGGIEKAWSSFDSVTTFVNTDKFTTTTLLWIQDSQKGFSVNELNANNENLGSVYAKSLYSATGNVKSVLIDVTKNKMTELTSNDVNGKVTYSVSHTLKVLNSNTTATETQTAYGSSLTAASTITAGDVVFSQVSGDTTTRHGVFGLTETTPIHFVDKTTTGTNSQHKIDNWYLSGIAAATSTNVSDGNKLITFDSAGNYSISGFKLGDVLHFSSTPTQTTISNPSTTDGKIDMAVTWGGNTANITLTGITNETDLAIGTATNDMMTNFNTVFGFGTSPII